MYNIIKSTLQSKYNFELIIPIKVNVNFDKCIFEKYY